MDKKYVYPYSMSEAKRNGELTQYRESFQENIRCAKAIQNTISKNFDGMHLGKDVAKEVIAEFGYDRVNFVLANTMKELKHDGRFSRENKEWAKGIYIPKNKVNGINMNAEFVVTSHPAVLDGFVNQARKEYQDLELWDHTHCNDKTHLDFVGKVMVLDPTYLKDEYKTPRDQLILCEGGFGCSPTASGRKVFGRFLSDGEKCQYDRSDFIGELKEELLPQWAREKIQEMTEQKQSSPDIGGMHMQ
ncbi:DUF3849 domain-containing protein [Niameybacter massiliensis]|uniref:DUF3849 domain-containing protein n=1 Tax=Holtiella tumoricola TaxID=3018743 RepID=A0AA42DM54_9FIRM|nr:DUF3849 domain-containing protein [Holtiella tumoricola]MDA3731408.1 DUF3849 domain-containing protein [Holtiella tumoricola]